MADVTTVNPACYRDAIFDVTRARIKARVEKGYDPAHDDAHTNRELIEAALAMLYCAHAGDINAHAVLVWPFEEPLKDRLPREYLVEAAQFIVAEIERMDRANAKAG